MKTCSYLNWEISQRWQKNALVKYSSLRYPIYYLILKYRMANSDSYHNIMLLAHLHLCFLVVSQFSQFCTIWCFLAYMYILAKCMYVQAWGMRVILHFNAFHSHAPQLSFKVFKMVFSSFLTQLLANSILRPLNLSSKWHHFGNCSTLGFIFFVLKCLFSQR